MSIFSDDNLSRDAEISHQTKGIPYNLVAGEPDVLITKNSENIGSTWQKGKIHEKEVIEIFYSLLKKRKDPFVVVDVGAQTGCFTLLAKYFPDSSWIAFEPLQEAYDELAKNIALNDIRCATLCQACVAHQIGWGSLKVPQDAYELGLSTLGERINRFEKFDIRKVPCVTLDGFFQNINEQRIDFLKIDTEGAEWFVLQGGESLICKNRPIILMEFTQDNMNQCSVNGNDIFQFLEKHHYEYQYVSDDLLCIPNEWTVPNV